MAIASRNPSVRHICTVPHQLERMWDGVILYGTDSRCFRAPEVGRDRGWIRFTLYPDTDHEGSWSLAYADPGLYGWLAGQSLR